MHKLTIRAFDNDDIQTEAVRACLKQLYLAIFAPPEHTDLDHVVDYFTPTHAKDSQVLIYYDQQEAVGFLCLQRYTVLLGKRMVNVFRSQAGLLKAYRHHNRFSPQALRFILMRMVRHPRRSYFFALCLHPSSYRAIVRSLLASSVWPTARQHRRSATLITICQQLMAAFQLNYHEKNGVYLYDYGLGGTRGACREADSINSDAQYFLGKNPHYDTGEAIAVVAHIRPVLALSCLAKKMATQWLGARMH